MPAIVTRAEQADGKEHQLHTLHDHLQQPISGLTRTVSAPEPDRPKRARPDAALEILHGQHHEASPTLDQNVQMPTLPASKSRWTPIRPTSSDERPDKRQRLDNHSEEEYTTLFKQSVHRANSRHDTSETTLHTSERSRDYPERNLDTPCHNCSSAEDVLSSVIRSLLELQSELSTIRIGCGSQASSNSDVNEVTKRGLRQALAWTVGQIRDTTRLVREASFATKALPPLADSVPAPSLADFRRGSLPSIATTVSENRQAPHMAEPNRVHDMYRRQIDYPKDAHISSPETALPPITPIEEMKRASPYDQGASASAQSPYPSSSSSMFAQNHSPVQSHQLGHRSLPSPPGSHFSTVSVSGGSQYNANSAAQASHLQDLQHQISTKTLALQTLQREHDQLLAAFSRSQIRCNTLDKKSQVSDHEINILTEEKIRLQQQVETLEAQVDDLQKSRDEVHKQTSADGVQWRQIMAMSSQLQIKSADDARKFKEERDAWEQDREAMERRISELQNRMGTISDTPYASSTDLNPTEADDALTSTSVDTLRREIVGLRKRCSELEVALQEVTGETEQLDRAITAMSSMKQRLASSRQRREDPS